MLDNKCSSGWSLVLFSDTSKWHAPFLSVSNELDEVGADDNDHNNDGAL